MSPVEAVEGGEAPERSVRRRERLDGRGVGIGADADVRAVSRAPARRTRVLVGERRERNHREDVASVVDAHIHVPTHPGTRGLPATLLTHAGRKVIPAQIDNVTGRHRPHREAHRPRKPFERAAPHPYHTRL
jgi:hypothetical protein